MPGVAWLRGFSYSVLPDAPACQSSGSTSRSRRADGACSDAGIAQGLSTLVALGEGHQLPEYVAELAVRILGSVDDGVPTVDPVLRAARRLALVRYQIPPLLRGRGQRREGAAQPATDQEDLRGGCIDRPRLAVRLARQASSNMGFK